MFRSIHRYYKGFLKIRITGYSPERFVNLCSKNHIDVRELTFVKDGYECLIDLKDFRKILRLVKKSKTRVRILKKYGLPFFLHRNRKRKAFVIGMAAAMVMLYVLSLFIWDIQFEGNTQYTSETLIKFLRDEGYDHGEKKSDIVCEDLEKLLRNEFNNMTWVSARIEGNRLIIQIKENEVISSTIEEGEPCNIVADKDGIITNMITKSGTSQVKVGDTVQKGQILVSGLVELTNDSGETIRIQEVEAQAEITASTVIDYSDTFDMVHEVLHYTGNTKTAYDLGWSNSFIHITPGGTSYDTYDVVTEDGQAVLLYNLDLPLKWKKTVYREYEVVEETYTEEEAKALASTSAQKYLEDLTEQDIIIDSYEFSITFIDGICQVSGRINTTQSLGTSEALAGEDDGIEGESSDGESSDSQNSDGENNDGENNDEQGEVVNQE